MRVYLSVPTFEELPIVKGRNLLSGPISGRQGPDVLFCWLKGTDLEQH